jgi:serine/threonine protein kinase
MLTPGRGLADERLGPSVTEGGLLGGRFVLGEELQYGRFGVVYRAFDRQPAESSGAACDVTADGVAPSDVALLIMPAEVGRNEHVLASLERDFVRARSLSHPHIVKLFELQQDAGTHFLTMQLVDGESLRSVLDSLGPELIPEQQALWIVRAVGEALAYAHAKGIVHGDVRPENVIVTARHDVKVLFSSSCLTGSAPFSVQPRDDVYGLACLAYELLLGVLPPLHVQQRGNERRLMKDLSRRSRNALRMALAAREDRTRRIDTFLGELGLLSAVPRVCPETARNRRSVTWRAMAAALLAALLGAAAYMTQGGLENENASLAGVSDERATVAGNPRRTTSPGSTADNRDAAAVVGAPEHQRRAAEQGTADGAARAASVSDTRMPSPEQPGGRRMPAAALASAPLGSAVSTATRGAGTPTFAAPSVTVNEDQGVVSIEIKRASGSDQRSVVWWTSDGTARAGDDYADFGGVVETFARGETSRVIHIPITSDGVPEDREHFSVNLSVNSTGSSNPGAITQVTVTIIDNDRVL